MGMVLIPSQVNFLAAMANKGKIRPKYKRPLLVINKIPAKPPKYKRVIIVVTMKNGR
jgi:hypothetical protein